MSMPISAERKMLLSSSSNRQPSHTSPPFLRPYTSLPLHLRRSVNENHHRGSRRQRRERRASLRNARFSRCGVQRRAASGPLRPGTPALGARDFQGAARSAEPSLARKPPANAANGRRRTLPNTLPPPQEPPSPASETPVSAAASRNATGLPADAPSEVLCDTRDGGTKTLRGRYG